ncbi:MAG: putative bifunctional diguanylate cyclase/phosphodiesterase [Bosea sp. (in: a-proteobacteria)]
MSLTSRSSSFINRASLLLGTIIVLVIALMAVTLMSMTAETNRQAARNQMKRLELAIAAQLAQATNDLSIVASSQEGRFGSTRPGPDVTVSSRLESAWHFFSFDAIYALDQTGKVIAGAEAGEPTSENAFQLIAPYVAHLVARVNNDRLTMTNAIMHDQGVRGVGRHLSASALVYDGASLTSATAIPVQAGQNRDASTIVALRNLPDMALHDIGQRYGLNGLHFKTGVIGSPGLSFPVVNASGDQIGFLSWQIVEPGAALLSKLLLVFMAGILAIALAFGVIVYRLRMLGAELASDERKADRLASHDHLSGLLNRRSFSQRISDELERSKRNHAGFALHLIDLDRFKEVNDTLGHQAGDEVIRETARRIADTIRGADIVARLGGDEFAIIQTNTETTIEAGALAIRLLEVLNRPITFGGAEITVGCSIGITLAPYEDRDGDGLMSLADSALYEAKNDGRNRHRFFEQSIDNNMKMKQLVEEELRDAIKNDQLELHYQPQVSPDGQRILGVEALVRWRHPVRGLIPPLDFISLAEERGLIIPLSNWVLRRACEDGKRWDGIKVAVNVSAAQFKQPNFVRDLVANVHAAGFDPTRLELELTEGMIVEDEEKAEKAINDLREHGISLALDDFGTGYSSLIYLRRFSFDKIKIDRSFLEAMETTGESAILVHSVVHLGRALGLLVCAEGIETEEQQRFLQAVGCHELQGYLFSRPVLAAKIDELLASPAPFAKAA